MKDKSKNRFLNEQDERDEKMICERCKAIRFESDLDLENGIWLCRECERELNGRGDNET